MAENHYPPGTQATIDTWQPYVASIADWLVLVKDVEPKATGCGPVYELGNPLGGVSASFAIADMRDIEYAHPHYHANGEIEIYFVLQGLGRVVVGNKVVIVESGSVVVTPSGVTHYALPDKQLGLVLGVLNTPAFNPDNNIDVNETDPAVRYDHEMFLKLTQQ